MNYTYGTFPIPTRKGYKFYGWYTSTDWTTKLKSTDSVNKNIKTVYAKWNDQAVLWAEKNTVATPYSAPTLEDALVRWGKFTQDQAEYGVENANIDWMSQAQRYAYNAVQNKTYTRAELIAEMVEYGFTQAQAEQGANFVEL